MKLYRLYDKRAEEFSNIIPAKSDMHLIMVTADSYYKAGQWYPDDVVCFQIGTFNDTEAELTSFKRIEVLNFAEKVNDEIRLLARRSLNDVILKEAGEKK